MPRRRARSNSRALTQVRQSQGSYAVTALHPQSEPRTQQAPRREPLRTPSHLARIQNQGAPERHCGCHKWHKSK
eukprot:12123605-Alexandrium_andersonii.AAC.1